MVEKAILYKLQNTAAITAYTSTRIYNQILPQETAMPCVVFSRISTQREDIAHSGAMGLAEAFMQISVYTEANASARGLANEIRKAFHCLKGTINGVVVMLSKVVQERDLYDSDQELYRVILELQIKYREATS